ncbi:hypothetical protein [Nocardioides alcanivorans]|uniref:hypothetical protein n=1 Tax=Nocardioides alcanivorans TaxID=2897352 RepID=UPI001F202B7F|nr:hypothetical protein [Nocardioides alcanivorans]
MKRIPRKVAKNARYWVLTSHVPAGSRIKVVWRPRAKSGKATRFVQRATVGDGMFRLASAPKAGDYRVSVKFSGKQLRTDAVRVR